MLCVFMCVPNCSTNLSFLPMNICVCVPVHRCHRVVTLPVTRTFWGANLRGGQPEDWQGHEAQSTGSQVVTVYTEARSCMCAFRQQKVLML